MTKYIVVTGGVISGVGKGVTTASLGKILKEYGYTVTLIKIDPYINYDAGTLRPTEHGEVWVTDDGGEIDQDLGTYERFLDIDIPKKNNMTTGQIYKAVIDRERSGAYLGKTVQFIPHIPEEIIKRIKGAAAGFDIAIIEIGGTVGDYENIAYLFACKMLERELGAENVVNVLVTYLPIPAHVNEMKTKPTQQAIKLLREEGIFPDFIVCRSQRPVDEVRKKKIDETVHVTTDHIISAPDLKTVYELPLRLEEEKVGEKLIKRLRLKLKKTPDWSSWQRRVAAIKNPPQTVNVAIVGKYLSIGDFELADSYVSIEQALIHSGAELNTGVKVTWINSQDFETEPQSVDRLSKFDGIIIPGGFGAGGVEGKISAINYVREHKIPFLGICYGMQLAAVEYARNVCGLQGAHTVEIDPKTKHPIIGLLEGQKNILARNDIGGTMRLGAYPALLKAGSQVLSCYEKRGRVEQDKKKIELFEQEHTMTNLGTGRVVLERHRHRYEVNPTYVPVLEDKGLIFSGEFPRPDGVKLMEFIELPGHPFFIGTQAHPEFKSRMGNPAPLFYGFVSACLDRHGKGQ